MFARAFASSFTVLQLTERPQCPPESLASMLPCYLEGSRSYKLYHGSSNMGSMVPQLSNCIQGMPCFHPFTAPNMMHLRDQDISWLKLKLNRQACFSNTNHYYDPVQGKGTITHSR
ncbi:hypothetical protein DPSP01_005723 [Paraphaeosphaeria sporulosa]